MRNMDAVVCVSEAQAIKVRAAGIAADKVVVIRNAIDAARFDDPNLEYRRKLLAFFPRPPARVVAAAGRLSPEKGFDVLIAAAAQVTRDDSATGFVLFGEGPLRAELERRVRDLGLADRFIF